MARREYGEWQSYPVTIIKDGTTTNVMMYKRKKPSGSWEFKDTTHPVVTTINCVKKRSDGNIQKRNTDTDSKT